MQKDKTKKPRGNQKNPPLVHRTEEWTVGALRNAEFARVAAWTHLFI